MLPDLRINAELQRNCWKKVDNRNRSCLMDNTLKCCASEGEEEEVMNSLSFRFSLAILIPILGALVGFSMVSECLATTNPEFFEYTITGEETVVIDRYVGDDKSVVIPASIKEYCVTKVGYEAFRGTAITSVEIPDSVTSIGEGAFFGCHNLLSIVIPDCVTSIESMAFQSCGNLRAAMFLGDAPDIETDAFIYSPVTAYHRYDAEGWGIPLEVAPPESGPNLSALRRARKRWFSTSPPARERRSRSMHVTR